MTAKLYNLFCHRNWKCSSAAIVSWKKSIRRCTIYCRS